MDYFVIASPKDEAIHLPKRNMEEIIKVQNLKKSFGSLDVIKDISFAVHKGEVLSIIGPSGSGKSTILRCVSQLEDVSGGSISICGKKLVQDGIYCSKEERHEIILQSGLVFQNFNLFPHYSVLQNVMQPQLKVLKKSKEEAAQTAMTLLERMGLGDKAASYPCQLSGGQQQRVAIARALAKNPKVLFLDEPTGALDEETGRQVLNYIIRLHEEQGFTMIMVTHNSNIAETADRIIKMNSGKIVSVTENTDKKTAYEIGW